MVIYKELLTRGVPYDCSIAYLIMLSYEVSLALAMHGTEEAMEKWLQGLCQGKKLGCLSVIESPCRSDVSAIKISFGA